MILHAGGRGIAAAPAASARDDGAERRHRFEPGRRQRQQRDLRRLRARRSRRDLLEPSCSSRASSPSATSTRRSSTSAVTRTRTLITRPRGRARRATIYVDLGDRDCTHRERRGRPASAQDRRTLAACGARGVALTTTPDGQLSKALHGEAVPHRRHDRRTPTIACSRAMQRWRSGMALAGRHGRGRRRTVFGTAYTSTTSTRLTTTCLVEIAPSPARSR